MPITLASAFKTPIEQPHSADPLLWLVDLEISAAFKSGGSVVPAVVLRVSSHSAEIQWPLDSPDEQTWYPYNFSFTPIEQNQEGDLPQIDLTVDNSARLLMRFLHAGDGMEGNRCTIYLVPLSAIATQWPNHVYQSWDLRIAGSWANEESVTFRLERANFFSRLAPQDRYVAARCRWAFGSPECGYIINAVAAYTSCPKTLAACIARGQDHASRRLPVLHPGRFGGFPGIPRQR